MVNWNFHTSYLNFFMCLQELCFPDCWKVLFVVPSYKNVGGRSMVKNYWLASLLSNPCK